jgi:hypothetical protein
MEVRLFALRGDRSLPPGSFLVLISWTEKKNTLWSHKESNPRPSGLQHCAWTNYATVCIICLRMIYVTFNWRGFDKVSPTSMRYYIFNPVWSRKIPLRSITQSFFILSLERTRDHIFLSLGLQPNLLHARFSGVSQQYRCFLRTSSAAAWSRALRPQGQ